MRLRLTLLMSTLVGLGLSIFFIGGVPSTADGSTTEGAGPRGATGGGALASVGAATDAADDSGAVGRRLSGLAEGLADALSQGAQGAPVPTPEQARAAAQLIALFNEFSLEAAGALYEKPSAGMEEWVEWLRARVGKCEAGEPMWVKGESVRYLYSCEHGQLEAGFQLDPDSGKIPGLVMGARGVELADPVREAAEAVMRLYDAWDPELYRRTFSEKFKMEEIRRFLLDVRSVHGDCELGEPDLVSVRGTLIHLKCERSVRLMKVELQQEDDRIRTLWIRDPRPGRQP